jgi:hypothetical protein
MFLKLQELAPEYGYYPEPMKSILIVAPRNLDAAKLYFADLKFKICTGSTS